MHRTLDDIRRDGLRVLKTRLGRAGMVRFLQQFETGRGDYARERHAWVDETSLDALRRHSVKSKTKKRRSKAG